MSEKYKDDCYYYEEVQDMGARIPCCTKHKYELGVCPCDICKEYISKADARKIIDQALKTKRGN